MAKLAETADRFDDMTEYIRRVAVMGTELSEQERSLLSVAYKNSVGAKRAAWRAVNQLEAREASKGHHTLDLINRYRSKVEEELKAKCAEIVGILAEHLIPIASTDETKVFLYKMQGDYQRYLAEFSAAELRGKFAEDAHGSYKQASEIAVAKMRPADPIRLGLALNFSVFYYEIFSSPEKACQLAKAAFDDAISRLDDIPADVAKDSSTIMQLLRDNLQLWTSNMQEQREDAGDAP